MENTRLNIVFIVLLVVTLVLFTFYYILDSEEIKVNDHNIELTEITGKMQSFEVYHGKTNFYQLTKKVSKRYDDKYFEYLWDRYELSVKSEKEKHEEERRIAKEEKEKEEKQQQKEEREKEKPLKDSCCNSLD